MAVATGLPLLGAVIVVAVGWDAVLTTIHPGRDGAVSRFAGGASRRSVQALVDATGRTGLWSWVGPSAMLLNFAIWLAGLLVGFALVYLPFLGQFRSASQPGGLVDAIYVSGVTLTTVGFGDIVAGSGTFQLVMVAEAAAGLAIFTAAITYLLSVYPLFIGLRCTALTISDRGLLDPCVAVEALLADGEAVLKEVHGMLVRSHGHVRSFPILYYFNPVERDESVYTLMRAGWTLLLIGRYGVADERLSASGTYLAALDRRLARITTDYTSRRPRWAAAPDPGDPGDAPLEELRAIVDSVESGAAQSGGDGGRSYPEARAAADAFLSLVAADRGYRHEPLLDPADDPR